MTLELGLYVITGESKARGRGHLNVAAAALAGGADVVQLRAKDTPARVALEMALSLAEMVHSRPERRLFLVNDRVDIALAAGADGVHLGQSDMPVPAARALLGPTAIIGATVTNMEEAVRAEQEGADYLGVGPVFETPTKPDAGDALGLDRLRDIKRRARIPVVAIGGINKGNLGEVLDTGADGIAVISAVTEAADMEKATRELREGLDRFRGKEEAGKHDAP